MKWFKNIGIGAKTSINVLLIVVLSLLVMSYVSYNFSKKTVEKKYIENINNIADQKVNNIESYFEQNSAITGLIYNSSPLNRCLNKLTELPYTQDSLLNIDSIRQEINIEIEDYFTPLKNLKSFNNILITTQEGLVIYTANESQFYSVGSNYNDPDKITISETLNSGSYLSKVYKEGDQFYFHLASKLASHVLILQVNLEPIFKILENSIGLGETGETLIAMTYSEDEIRYISPLKYDSSEILTNIVTKDNPSAIPIKNALFKKENGLNIGLPDYRNITTLSSWRYIPIANWGLVVKIDLDEVHEEINGILFQQIIAGIAIVIIALLISIYFSRVLILPLLSLRTSVQLLAQGILPDKVLKRSNDEIGEIAHSMDFLVQALKRTAEFARKIGRGELDAKFKPLSEQDALGVALIDMRNSIQDAEKRDKERNWIVTGMAEVGEILRIHNDAAELGNAVISYVTDKINAVQGAFYVVNEQDSKLLDMMASYAYNKRKYLEASFKFAEGLVGQAAVEMDTILRTEIPEDYITITSGILGDQRPTCLLITPLIANEEVYGVLEFAGFDKFNESQVKFVEEISLITARTVFNIKVNERTKNLLTQSQKMGEELKIQQEELKQNAEEMEATQEELRRTNQRLEDQIEEVNRTQKRMQLLLENASEVITIYEEDGTVRYISPSVEKILGYSQEEVIGIKDIKHVHKDGREAVETMFASLLEQPEEAITIQFEYKRKDGDTIWLEAKGTNLLADAAIQGILVNSIDITERRRAEKEERMRSQMQALSENSPDLITRMNKDGMIYYINPVIESYTGNTPDHFLNRAISDTNLSIEVTEKWFEILNAIIDSQDKVSLEMDFSSELGKRVMQVNGIPEYNEEDKIESILLVSHDITTRKAIELEIQAKNKKITESINYAKRIQGAILPSNKFIKQVLPDSFILYKARDVVSGDFPWFIQVGNTIYIAAVDCTGHGVPGALISLIGYFLLNDIVRSRKISNPGTILDELDASVTSTLKQDQEDTKMKDGMDLALCKICLDENTIEYAGAHRSLFYINNGELEEIKGNKFPIGGGLFKNQTNFTNHTIKYHEGDAIYFCSDGFPDQFGGPDNRKFGSKRLRELINNNKHLNMEQAYEKFLEEWEAWKGDQKQTDDVLLIGIRF